MLTRPTRHSWFVAILTLAAGLVSVSSASAQSRILWDANHGIYSSFYTLPNGFSNFASVLNGLGYDIQQNSIGVLHQSLSQYDVLIVSALTAANSAYSAAEVAAIQTFVQSGGGLLIMGENSEIPSAGVNSVGAAYGMKLNTNKVIPADTYVTNLTSHEMFQGIQSIYMRYGGEIQASAGATIVGTTAAGKAMIANAAAGRVIGLGDSNLFDDSYLQTADNIAYVARLFDYLAGGCFTDLGPGLAGTGGLVPEIAFGSGSCGGLLSLGVQNALGGASSILLVGTSASTLSAQGGTIYVDVAVPPILLVSLPLGGAPGQPGAGTSFLTQDLTAYLPLTLTFQLAVFDPGAPYGIALSNGLKIDMQP